jgi:hypothetical protein
MTAENMTSDFNLSTNASYPVKEDLKNDVSSRRKTKKEALMELIAQEMVTSLLGDEADAHEQDDDDDILKEFQAKLAKKEAARKMAKKKAAAKRKLKQEQLRQQRAAESPRNVSDSHHQKVEFGGAPSSAVIQEYESRIGGYEELDDDSFAGLGLEELMSPSHKSVSSSSHGSTKTPVSESASTDSISREGSTMSVEEIRNYVLASIPQAVRDQIPQEAWSEIFQGSTTGSKQSSKRSVGSRSKTSVESAPIVAVEQSSCDDISVISDVTGFIHAFPDGKRVEKTLSMSQNDFRCPGRLSSEVTGETSSRTEHSSFMEQSTDYDESVASPVPRPAQAGPKSVAFGTVTLRYYERMLSDNPAVQSGPAIGIGWRYKRGGLFDVDEFEQGRHGARSAEELVLPREVREKMLKDAGFSQKDIADMVRVILKSKNQRKQTVNNLNTQGVEEAVELARKRVGRLLSFGKQSDILK